MSITFATFAAYGAPQLPDGTIEQISLHTWSIRKSHGPEATAVLLTDDILSDERVLKQFDIVRRRPVAKSTLLLDRARHYREFLDAHNAINTPWFWIRFFFALWRASIGDWFRSYVGGKPGSETADRYDRSLEP